MADHHDGIAWREWSDEAFAEALADDKLVLLDIGAVWCHWCHVMDTGIEGDPVHTGTYSHPLVQQLIAEHYVPIKVDNDRRPDINARYNMGGWPTTAFLTPNGETLFGETYVTPERMAGLLEHIADLWSTQRDQIIDRTEEMRTRRRTSELDEPRPADVDPATVSTVLLSIKRHFDFGYGGFGREPKFPHPSALMLTIEQYAKSGESELKVIAEKTLRGMDSGGMYDRYAGGFFRYSTTRDWSIPHYEKMLEDNAKLTAAYLLASVALDDNRSMETVRSAHGWLLADMLDHATSTFAGSQDADAEEKYYGMPPAIRATMPTPYIDRTIYANWNALMVSSFAMRYQLTGEQEILAQAERTFAFLRDAMAAVDERGRTVLAHYRVPDQPELRGGPGLLTDQVDYIGAALDLYESTGNVGYLTAARSATAFVLDELEDKADGGFWDLRASDGAIGELAKPKKDIGENSDAALAFLRLAALTEESAYRNSAHRALQAFAASYGSLGYFSAQYARAVDAFLGKSIHIVIVTADGSSEATRVLRSVAWRTIAPGKVVQTIDPTGDDRYPAGKNGEPIAYVCVGSVCLAPASTPDALRDRVFEALS